MAFSWDCLFNVPRRLMFPDLCLAQFLMMRGTHLSERFSGFARNARSSAFEQHSVVWTRWPSPSCPQNLACRAEWSGRT